MLRTPVKVIVNTEDYTRIRVMVLLNHVLRHLSALNDLMTKITFTSMVNTAAAQIWLETVKKTHIFRPLPSILASLERLECSRCNQGLIYKERTCN